MNSIAILEGQDIFSNDVDLLGWPSFLRPSKIKKGIRKISRPIKKLTRPITRPMDRIIKKIPVVRTAYRAGITASYAATLQFKKVKGAAIRTARAAKKDFAGAKKAITRYALKIVTPLARKGLSKTAAKVAAIPTVSAFASSSFGPWAIPFVGSAVNSAINLVWNKLKKIMPKSVSSLIKGLNKNKISKAVTNSMTKGGRFNAQKFLSIPEAPPPGFTNVIPKPVAQTPKKSITPLLALVALPLLMG